MTPALASGTIGSMTRLAGSKKHHVEQRDVQMDILKQRLKAANAALDRGSCAVAYMNVLEMWEAKGASEAHGRESGSTAWFPQTSVSELAYAFTSKCLRAEPATLGRARRRRR